MVAVSNGHKDVVRVLLEGGADPRAMAKDVHASYAVETLMSLKEHTHGFRKLLRYTAISEILAANL